MLEYSDHKDADLLHLLKNGDHMAYKEIYDRYWGILYRHSLRMLQDAEQWYFHSWLTTQSYPLGAALIINVAGKIVTTINGRLTIIGVTSANVQNNEGK